MSKLDFNVAGRPFVNQRPLTGAAAVLAGLLAVATFANVHAFFSALLEVRSLSARVVAARTEVEQARREAKALAGRMSEPERRRLRAVAAAATAIVEKRRLSWSRLFDQLEAILPRDVRVLQVSPDVRDSRLVLLMECQARDNEAKLKFYRKLHEPPFSDAYILGENLEEDKIRFSVKCNYDPRGVDAAPIHEPMPWEVVRLGDSR